MPCLSDQPPTPKKTRRINAARATPLDDAAKKVGDEDHDIQAHRQARAYKLNQIVLAAAMQQQQLIEEQMAAFLPSAPELAQRLAHWQSDDAKT